MPNNESSEKRRTSIQSIDRATAILKALASGPRRLGVSELADRLGLARPTVHGLLQTLQSHGFVEQDAYSEKYQLGPGLLQLGYSYLDLNELRARSISHADHLATRTGAAVRVGVMHGASVVVVHHVFRPPAACRVSSARRAGPTPPRRSSLYLSRPWPLPASPVCSSSAATNLASCTASRRSSSATGPTSATSRAARAKVRSPRSSSRFRERSIKAG